MDSIFLDTIVIQSTLNFKKKYKVKSIFINKK